MLLLKASVLRSAFVGAVRTRRTRAELRELVLAAGRDLLAEIEPTLGFEQLTYGRVFSRIEQEHGVRVTHASVHERIWPSQEAYQLDVLRSSLGNVHQESMATYTSPMRDLVPDFDLETLQGRREALAELFRVGQNANWDVIVGDEGIRIRAMVSLQLSFGTSPTDGASRDELRRFVDEQHQLAIARYRASIEWTVELLGLRPRPELLVYDDPYAHLGWHMNRLALAFLLDHRHDRSQSFEVPSGPNGELREWRAVSVAVWNYARGSLEFADEGLSPQERLL